jgi:hypothetical protein
VSDHPELQPTKTAAINNNETTIFIICVFIEKDNKYYENAKIIFLLVSALPAFCSINPNKTAIQIVKSS